ncbi:ABC transporter F family member 4-like [Astyanax mexicanus]|uniref:ABC transporter F family member 4-like n=1 Tax=Astyanax mexicanus TaxID=7994 RepID=A0A8T2LWU0_ASTMX|nr:ABC transporter F family member 4-like [Astyanax mexicanus]
MEEEKKEDPSSEEKEIMVGETSKEEVKNIEEMRKLHMEKEKQRKKEMMKRMFAPGGLIFRPQQEDDQRRPVRRQREDLKPSSCSVEEHQKTEEETEKPPRPCWPVSSNGEAVVITVKPLHPFPEEEGTELGTSSSGASAKGSIGGEFEEVFTEPDPSEAEDQTSLNQSNTSTPADTTSEIQPNNQQKGVVNWISKKLHQRHERAIEKSIQREKKHGNKFCLVRMPEADRLVRISEYEKMKRQRMQIKEENRQEMIKKWNDWQEKRAAKKAEKKERKEEKKKRDQAEKEA